MLFILLSAGLVGLFLLLLQASQVLLLRPFDLSLHLSFHSVHLLAHLLHDLGPVGQLSVPLVNSQDGLFKLVLKLFDLALKVFVFVLNVGILFLNTADLIENLPLVFYLHLKLGDLLGLVVGELTRQNLTHSPQVLVPDGLLGLLGLLEVSDALERGRNVIVEDLGVDLCE